MRDCRSVAAESSRRVWVADPAWSRRKVHPLLLCLGPDVGKCQRASSFPQERPTKFEECKGFRCYLVQAEKDKRACEAIHPTDEGTEPSLIPPKCTSASNPIKPLATAAVHVQSHTTGTVRILRAQVYLSGCKRALLRWRNRTRIYTRSRRGC